MYIFMRKWGEGDYKDNKEKEEEEVEETREEVNGTNFVWNR